MLAEGRNKSRKGVTSHVVSTVSLHRHHCMMGVGDAFQWGSGHLCMRVNVRGWEQEDQDKQPRGSASCIHQFFPEEESGGWDL